MMDAIGAWGLRWAFRIVLAVVIWQAVAAWWHSGDNPQTPPPPPRPLVQLQHPVVVPQAHLYLPYPGAVPQRLPTVPSAPSH